MRDKIVSWILFLVCMFVCGALGYKLGFQAALESGAEAGCVHIHKQNGDTTYMWNCIKKYYEVRHDLVN